MRRRLTLSILLAVAAALLLVGVGTLVLARFGARKATEDDLRSQVESMAEVVRISAAQTVQYCSNSRLANRDPALYDALCNGEEQDVVAQFTTSLCPATNSVDGLPAGAVQAARETFCTNPGTDTLDALRVAVCNASATAAGPRANRIRNYCTLLQFRSQKSSQLQSTLSKESIGLVVVNARDEVTQGELPSDVSAADIDPERLRNGETVVGGSGAQLFAAHAVVTGAPSFQAIVISRPADPVRGLIPWFLIASGATLLIGLFVATTLSRRLTKPLQEATIVTARIAHGDLSVRVPEHTLPAGQPRDEIDELAHSINAMAEALERSKVLEQQFLLSVSHDLRTPLTSIRGYAEAIADGAVPDPTQAGAVILAESRRLERLVRDLLDLAKLDARQFTLHATAVDLAELAEDSVDGFRHETSARGLHLLLAPVHAPVTVRADPDRLQQVVANLVEIAIKYARSTITVQVIADSVAPRIEVADDGPGISPEDLPHVFERLYVATARPERKEKGSGLGLAIARELVEAMGGRMAAAENPGGGARMIVWLPPWRPDPPPSGAAPGPPTGPRPE